jgi:hypothetical protein
MEKGEGIDIAKKYQVSCYPTYLFIDGNGQLVHRKSGSMPVKDFIELGANARNPAKQFAAYQKKYDSGTITLDETAEYILMRTRTCFSVKGEMAKYFAAQKESDLTNANNWSVLSECRADISADSREFKYLTDHRADYEKLYTQQVVSELIESCYSFALKNYIKDKNTDGYNKLRDEIQNKNLPFAEEMLLSADITLYKSLKDWNNYAQSAAKYVEKFKKDDSNALNTFAWEFYEKVDDKGMLSKAEEWAKHSVELQPAYANNDTYAAVLYKLGKKAEARVAAEKAIELAKKEGQDYKETQALLDKLKAGI